MANIRTFAFADALIVSIMAACIFATSASFKTSRPNRVVIFKQNAVAAEYPLDDDIAFSVAGKKGPVNIEIKNGAAMIVHADCPRNVCQLSGGIRRSHEQLICAPNNILIEIRSSENDNDRDIDGISY